MESITVKDSVLGSRIIHIEDDFDGPVFQLKNGRQYQADIVFDHLRKNHYTLTVSPTGSGKSIIIATDVARHKKNVIIATPKLSINSGFLGLTKTDFEAKCNGKSYKLPASSFKTPLTDKAAEIKKLLDTPRRSLIVCSHASLTNFMNRCDKATKKLLKNTVIYLDEIHHSDVCNGNAFGRTVTRCMDLSNKVHGFTATPFRTDGTKSVDDAKFVKHRRTLKTHYLEGQCPDFSIHVRFYDKTKSKKRDLINSYLDEYKKNKKHATLMIVDNKEDAFKLYKSLKAKHPKKKIVNLGSDDGKKLVSELSPQISTERYDLLKQHGSANIVIAIKMTDEGSDWPDCSQTFSPRVSSSLQLIMQRSIGRTMRKKPKNPKSRVVFFELGVDLDDSKEAVTCLFKFAIRLKALCDGIDFADNYKFRLPRQLRQSLDKTKTQFINDSDTITNSDYLSEILEMQAKGATNKELIDKYAKLCKINCVVALELLISQKILVPDDTQSNKLSKFLKRLHTTVDSGIWDSLEQNEEYLKLLNEIQTSGISQYFKMLGVDETTSKIKKILEETFKISKV